MPDRHAITAKLAAQRAELIERYRAMDVAELTSECTASEIEDAAPWSAADHLAHLAMIERAFEQMVRRFLSGEPNPVGLGTGSREQVMGRVHKNNQDNVETHRGDDLETLIADLDNARQSTLVLLDELSDEQLAAKLPGAPWADGTIGGVLMTNAYHQMQHLLWVEEGLAARPTT